MKANATKKMYTIINVTFANVIRSNILGFCWSGPNELPRFVWSDSAEQSILFALMLFSMKCVIQHARPCGCKK